MEFKNSKSDGWSVKKLGDLVTSISSGSLPKVIDQKPGDYPVIKVGDISRSKSPFIYECKTFLDVSGIKHKKIANKGDILMIQESGSKSLVGKSFLYLGDQECVVGVNMYIIKHTQNPQYLLHALNSSNIQNQIKIGTGRKNLPGSLSRIREEELRNILVPIPNLDQQERISVVLDQLF